MRSHYGQFPEYHTSADDPDFVEAGQLADALATVPAVFDVLEGDERYLNLNPKCEPQLGRRGLYSAMGGSPIQQLELAMLWVLNLSDGRHGLLDIAERAGLPFHTIHAAAQLLLRHELLAPCGASASASQH